MCHLLSNFFFFFCLPDSYRFLLRPVKTVPRIQPVFVSFLNMPDFCTKRKHFQTESQTKKRTGISVGPDTPVKALRHPKSLRQIVRLPENTFFRFPILANRSGLMCDHETNTLFPGLCTPAPETDLAVRSAAFAYLSFSSRLPDGPCASSGRKSMCIRTARARADESSVYSGWAAYPSSQVPLRVRREPFRPQNRIKGQSAWISLVLIINFPQKHFLSRVRQSDGRLRLPVPWRGR